jgi:fatty-acyl-CoA synthase
VGTLAWNTTRHLEAWYGIMGLGAVCHTLNPRLSPADLTYIINHAGDSWILSDVPLLPLLLPLLKDCPGVKGVVLLTDR